MKTKKEVAKWLKNTSKQMWKDDEAECASLFLDEYHDISLSIGWLDGYDPNDKGYYSSRKQPTYVLNAGLVKYNPMDCCDLMFMEMPLDVKSGDVYDTEVSLSEHTDWDSLASFYLKHYKEMMKELEAGTLK